MAYLGNTLEAIAYEKACIIKNKAVVVTSNTLDNIVNVITKKADNLAKQIILANKDYYILNDYLYYNNLTISLKNLALKGQHQQQNSALAIVSILSIISDASITKIESALQKTKWCGRLQEIQSFYNVSNNSSKMYLDGAHNPSGGESLRNFINKEQPKKTYMIFAMLNNKDLEGYLKHFQNCNIEIIPFDTNIWADDFHTYHNHQEIYNVCNKLKIVCNVFNNNDELLSYLNRVESDSLILICGSLYFIGHIMKDNNIIPI